MQKSIIYVRVSSKEQKQEGYSIPAQKKLLQQYAKANDFEIVKEFEDDETAKSEGRKGFGEMIKYLKNNIEVSAVLVKKQTDFTVIPKTARRNWKFVWKMKLFSFCRKRINLARIKLPRNTLQLPKAENGNCNL